MKLINLIDKVKTWCLTTDTLYFVKNQELYQFKAGEISALGITFPNNLQELKFGQTALFVNDTFGKGIIIEGGELHLIDNYILAQLNPGQFLVSSRESGKKTTGILDMKTGSIVGEMGDTSLIFKIDGDFLYTSHRRGRFLECFSLLSGFKWKFDLSALSETPVKDIYNPDNELEAVRLIGVLNQKIWVALNHHTVIALDVQTGELLHQISGIPSFSCAWLPAAIPAPEVMTVDEKHNRLIGFMWEFYWEIDPVTGVVELTDLTKMFKEQKIRNDGPHSMTDTHIYFASQNESKIGRFHRESKSIDGEYTFQKNEQGEMPRIIQVKGNENLTGALDLSGNLYLFE